MKHIALATFAVIITLASLGCTPAKKIARAYGEDRFAVVRELAFTCNIKDSSNTITRSWTWQPGDSAAMDRITLVVEGKPPLTYTRSDVNEAAKDEIKEADTWFKHDIERLLFAHRLAQRGVTATEPQPAEPTAGDGLQLKKMEVTLPRLEGDAGGETYELILNDDWLIVHSAPQGESANITTWENNQRLGPLVVATQYKDSAGSQVSYTDLSARLWGHDGRFIPEPLD